MKRWRVLVSAPYFQMVLDQYREPLESRGMELVVPPVTERLSERELLELVGDIHGVIAGDDHFTKNVLLKATPALKVISKWGTGIDAFDLDACKALGVTVCNTPGAFTMPVADSVIGYILAFARQLPWMDQRMKSGVWRKLPGRSMSESVLGIIGFGNIGRAVAKRARAFDMKVLVNDILPIDERVVQDMGVEVVEKPTLLQNSDYVSLNCDLNATSQHLLNNTTLGQMKPSAVVINTARGPIIDESALITALETGTIAGAALDVFEEEPLPLTSPLLKMPNVLLAPHNSNSSPSAWVNVHENTMRNLFRVLEAGA